MPPFGSMKTDARTLKGGQKMIEIGIFMIDNAPFRCYYDNDLS
jgi:hypothetical protein